MNKYIIGALVLAVVLIFAARYFDNDQETVSAVPSVSSALTVVEEPYNFGDIDIFGGKVSTTYTLKNEGTEDVTVTKAGTSCMCTEGVIAGLTFGMHSSEVNSVVIPAGGEEKVQAIYDPLAHGPNGTGPVTRELMLATNSVVTPEVRMKFSGNVIKN
tara:strand:+ start:3077 stop:3550 length:474 start_codon:yes stop_codon:yes gene_type:complete